MADEKSSGLTSAMPVIGAGIDAISNIFGGLFNANQASKNRAFQERMYYRQLLDQRENWRMMNEYSSPSAQLARLREAGLSPLLMYQGSNPGVVATSPAQGANAPSGAQAQMSGHTNFGQAMAQSAMLSAQIRMMNAEADKSEAAAAKSRSETTGTDFLNWLNDQTRNVQVALKYGDLDYVNQLIRESSNRVFQSSFVNAHEMAALSLQNSLAIRKQNLSEYQVGENIRMGWEYVLQGKITASAQMKQAFAAMMNATTAAKLSNGQLGLMRAQAANFREQTKFLSQSRDYRVQQEYNKNMLLKKDVSWYDILRESGVSKNQSEIFLNSIRSEYERLQTDWMPIQTMMSPFNMLTGFGAGAALGGNIGRVKVTGFQ